MRTNELADSPLLGNSPLYQQTIYVDASVSGTNPDGTIWQGTAIANASGWIGLTTRSLDERLMNGAPISIGGIVYPQSGTVGAVNLVQSSGSAINVSGGYTTYTPGFVRVSRLVDQYGRIVSVSNADPNDVYVGICCSFSQSHPHWGVTETFASPLSVTFAANDAILLPGGNPITLPAGVRLDQNSNRQWASFTASANTVDIGSPVTVPGGTIAFPGAFTFTSANELQVNPNSSSSLRSGSLTIGPGITLSAAGLWTNDAGATSLAPIASNGGKITLGAYGDIELGQGSILDVSAGAYENGSGKISMGTAGTLKVTAGLAAPSPPKSGDNNTAYFPNVSYGTIHFDGGLQPGQLKGYGGAGNGGTLALTSYAVATITPASEMDGALMREGAQATDALGNPYATLAVSTDFFSAGGFANVSLTAAGVSLPANVTLAPAVSPGARTAPLTIAIWSPVSETEPLGSTAMVPAMLRL